MSRVGEKDAFERSDAAPNKDSVRKRPLRAIIFLGFLFSILLGPAVAFSISGKTPNFSYNDIFLVFMSYVFLLGLLAGVFKLKIDKQILILISLFILAQIISLAINQSDLPRAIVSIKILANGIIAYFIITSVSENIRETDWMLNMVVVFGSAIAILLIIVFVFFFNPSIEFQKILIILAFGKSNYVASFLVFILPIGLGLFFSANQSKNRVFFGGCTLLMLLGLLITVSRGAFLSLGVGIVIVLPILLRKKARLKYLLSVAVIAVLLFVIVTSFFPDPIIQKNIEMIKYRIENPDYGRILLLENSWNIFIKHPIFGIGPFQTSTTYSVGTAHNFVVQALADLGLMGTVPFLLIILLFLIRAYKNCIYERNTQRRLENVFILAAILVTLMHGLVELTFQGAEYMSVFWVIMAIVTLRYRSYHTEDSSI